MMSTQARKIQSFILVVFASNFISTAAIADWNSALKDFNKTLSEANKTIKKLEKFSTNNRKDQKNKKETWKQRQERRQREYEQMVQRRKEQERLAQERRRKAWEAMTPEQKAAHTAAAKAANERNRAMWGAAFRILLDGMGSGSSGSYDDNRAVDANCASVGGTARGC